MGVPGIPTSMNTSDETKCKTCYMACFSDPLIPFQTTKSIYGGPVFGCKDTVCWTGEESRFFRLSFVRYFKNSPVGETITSLVHNWTTFMRNNLANFQIFPCFSVVCPFEFMESVEILLKLVQVLLIFRSHMFVTRLFDRGF